MTKICASKALRFGILMAAIFGVHAGCNAQSGSPSGQSPQDADSLSDRIVALAGSWDHHCSEKGCVMFTDVLIGDPDHPADLKHPEYITIGVSANEGAFPISERL